MTGAVVVSWGLIFALEYRERCRDAARNQELAERARKLAM